MSTLSKEIHVFKRLITQTNLEDMFSKKKNGVDVELYGSKKKLFIPSITNFLPKKRKIPHKHNKR